MVRLADLSEALRQREYHVVCLPDFFLDHFVRLPPYSDASTLMKAIHDRGGGNLPVTGQTLVSGGNAANTAKALARLGVRAHLIARTSHFGATLLHETLGRAGVDLSLVRSDGQLAITAALEYGSDPRNVMLSDPGSVATFGPQDLDDNARTLIEAADGVLVANWTLARMHGTALAMEVFRLARKGHALTYFDTGDPSARSPKEVRALLDALAANSDLDVFAMNDNELRFYGGEGEPMDTAARLAKVVHCTIDVHTSKFAATWSTHGHHRVPTFPVTVQRATGAGDVWNAANLVCHMMQVEPEERLRFANACAGLYLAHEVGMPPTLVDALSFAGI
ncbi:MAG: carbohydrate kinase family protein [Thermoplasmatota archaeon]